MPTLEGLLGMFGGGGQAYGQAQPNDGTAIGDVDPATGRATPVRQFDDKTLQLASAYGLPPEVIAQQQDQQRQAVLGNLASTLLAAGQAGPVGQRGQILSKMDFTGGEQNMSKQLLNSAQMRLYAESLKEKQADRAAREAFAANLAKGTLPGIDSTTDSGKYTLNALQALGPKAYDAFQTIAVKRLTPAEYTPIDENGMQRNLQTGKVEYAGPQNVQESAESKAVGEALGKRQNDTVDAYTKAPGALNKLDLFGQINARGFTGTFADQKAQAVGALKSLGASDDAIKTMGLEPDSNKVLQTFTKLASESLKDHIGAGGIPAQNFSDADMKTVRAMSAAANNDPRANEFVIELAKAKAQRDLDKGRAWYQYQKQAEDAGKKAKFGDFDRQFTEYASKNDMFGAVRDKAIKAGIIKPEDVAASPAPNVSWRIVQ